MLEFISKQNRKLLVQMEDGGIAFHYATRQAVFHVGQSWANIHTLLAKLYNCQEYAAGNRSLSVWMKDQELWLQFRRERRLEAECSFSPAETLKIMDFLGKAPNMN